MTDIYSSCGVKGLIEYEKKTLEQLDKSTTLLQESLKNTLSPDSLNKFEDKLNSDYQKWEKGSLEVKSKKFQRDVLDYQQHKVYKWQNSPYKVADEV